MKELFAKSAAVLLLAASGARATNYSWNGNTSSFWDEPNWSVGPFGSQNYPGQSQAGDTALIADDMRRPVVLDVSLYSLATVDVDADRNAETVELKLESGSNLTTSGLVTVKSYQQDGTPTATLWYQNGTFAPNALRFWGQNHPTQGHAKGDLDASFTVTNDLTIRQFVDLFILSGRTVTVNGTLQVGKDLDDFFGYVKVSDGGTIEAETLVIEGDANGSTLEVTSGAVKTK